MWTLFRSLAIIPLLLGASASDAAILSVMVDVSTSQSCIRSGTISAEVRVRLGDQDVTAQSQALFSIDYDGSVQPASLQISTDHNIDGFLSPIQMNYKLPFYKISSGNQIFYYYYVEKLDLNDDAIFDRLVSCLIFEPINTKRPGAKFLSYFLSRQLVNHILKPDVDSMTFIDPRRGNVTWRHVRAIYIFLASYSELNKAYELVAEEIVLAAERWFRLLMSSSDGLRKIDRAAGVSRDEVVRLVDEVKYREQMFLERYYKFSIDVRNESEETYCQRILFAYRNSPAWLFFANPEGESAAVDAAVRLRAKIDIAYSQCLITEATLDQIRYHITRLGESKSQLDARYVASELMRLIDNDLAVWARIAN